MDCIKGHKGHKIYEFVPGKKYIIRDNSVLETSTKSKAIKHLKYLSENKDLWFFETEIGTIESIRKLIPKDEITVKNIAGNEVKYKVIVPRREGNRIESSSNKDMRKSS